MNDTGNRLQFCLDDQDITDSITREHDATEVRVWDEDDCAVVAVGSDDAGQWRYTGSDYGADPEWDTDAEFGGWEQALRAFGYGSLVE